MDKVLDPLDLMSLVYSLREFSKELGVILERLSNVPEEEVDDLSE